MNRTIRRTRQGPIHRAELSALLGKAAFGRPLQREDSTAELSLVWAALRIGIRLAQKGSISASDSTFLAYRLDRPTKEFPIEKDFCDQFGCPFNDLPHA